MTYHKKDKIPKKVFNGLKKYAHGYDIRIYDDVDCIAFLNKYFGPRLVRKFKNFQCGAHKADLFRYCVLYVHGGIYLDIKTKLLEPVKKTFPNNYLYTVLSINDETIFQAIISSPARNFMFLELIRYVYRTIPHDYLLYTYDFYTKIKKRVHRGHVQQGLNKMKPGELPIFLYQEDCSNAKYKCRGLNRYGLCCIVRDENGNARIRSRYNDFGIRW